MILTWFSKVVLKSVGGAIKQKGKEPMDGGIIRLMSSVVQIVLKRWRGKEGICFKHTPLLGTDPSVQQNRSFAVTTA